MMNKIDHPSEPAHDEIFEPLSQESFQFDCHRGVACFTECCAKLRLLLTPYDIVRMKNRLNMSSNEFLDHYTDTDLTIHGRFPMVVLKMTDDEARTCPFVTHEGCRIYQDRPGACRLYPVGRATMTGGGKYQNAKDKFFLVHESHCLGFNENKTWTLAKWLDHEGVKEYNSRNDQWFEIIGSKKSLGPKETIQKKVQMFYMASYNLDKFRSFVFESRFLDLFHLDQKIRTAVGADDEALMSLAFKWLRFSLFGEKTMEMK